MSFVTVFYACLFYAASAVLVGGLAYRVYSYARAPAPLKIPTTPAPTTEAGVVGRMAREVILFESLFKSNKWIWLFGWIFHASLLLVLLRHLRYFTQPVWEWVALIQPFGKYAAFPLVASLAALLARRLFVPRVKYISTLSDHLMLVLLLLIALSGLAIDYLAHTDIVSLKEFILGLMYLDWQDLPTDLPLLIHLFLVVLLMAIFPVSKLLHAPGIFFSPTRNQVDDSRERRHLAPWAANMEK